MEPPTLDDIVKKIGIHPTFLDRSCSDDHLTRISLFLDWRRVAPHLRLKRPDIDEIESKKTEPEKRLETLQKWKMKYGSKATFKVLVEVLLRVECADHAERVCQLLQPQAHTDDYCNATKQRPIVQQQSHDSEESISPPESEISIPECNILFSLFITELIQLLEKHEGALSNILTFLEHLVLSLHNEFLVKIFQPEKFQGVQSIRDLFHLLAPHWGYIDCSLLHPIAKASGCKPALERVEEFLHNREQSASGLILEKHQQSSDCDITLSSSGRVLQGSCQHTEKRSQSPRVIKKQPQPPVHEEVVEMKVDANVLTLRDYDENTSLLCGVLKLPRYVMSYFSTGSGCISLKWLMSKELVPYIQNTCIRSSDLIALAQKHITEIRVGSYYKITVPSVAYLQEDTGSAEEMRDQLEYERENLVREKEQHQKQEEALLKACAEGRLEDVTALLSQDTDVNTRDPKGGDTALTLASWKGYTTVVKELLAVQANVNMQDNVGNTALIKTSREGHTAIVKELLRAQADINTQNEDGDTALTLASWKGHIAVVKELLVVRANVNAQDNVGNTALIKTSREGHTDIVKELLRAQAAVNMQNKYGDTALHWASYSGHSETVKELLESGADSSIRNNTKGTALMEACSGGHSEVAILLIHVPGAEIDLQSERGSTALLVASLKGMTETVTELLKKGADVNIQNKDGLTPLLAATQENHTEIVKLLDAGAADINIRETDKADVTQTHVLCQVPQEKGLPQAKHQTKKNSAGDPHKPSRGDHKQPALKARALKAGNYVRTQLEKLWRRISSF